MKYQNQLIIEIKPFAQSAHFLIELFQNKDPSFFSKTKEWLSLIEKILQKYRHPRSLSFGGMRAALLAAEEGVFDPKYEITDTTEKNQQKILEAMASLQISEGQFILEELLSPHYQRRQEASQTLQELIAVGWARRLLVIPDQAVPTTDLHAQMAARQLWHAMEQLDDLRESLSNLLILVSFEEALQMLQIKVESFIQNLQNH